MTNQPGELRSQPWWRFWLMGYAVAAASVAIVLLLRENALAQRALDATPLLLAAIGVTAWFGGVGPGLVAVGTIHVHAAPAQGTQIDVWVPSKGLAS